MHTSFHCRWYMPLIYIKEFIVVCLNLYAWGDHSLYYSTASVRLMIPILNVKHKTSRNWYGDVSLIIRTGHTRIRSFFTSRVWLGLNHFFSFPGPIYITSSKGNRLIRLDGYRFCKQRTTGPKTRWCCGTHMNKGCCAYIHTIGDEIVKCLNVHNHNRPVINN